MFKFGIFDLEIGMCGGNMHSMTVSLAIALFWYSTSLIYKNLITVL